MVRGTFVYRNGELVPKHLAEPLIRPARSDIAAPYLALDTMAPIKSMLDGKMYDSKAALRRTYKAAGVREIGNEVDAAVKDAAAPKSPKPPARPDLIAAYHKVKQGYRPPPAAAPNDPDLD